MFLFVIYIFLNNIFAAHSCKFNQTNRFNVRVKDLLKPNGYFGSFDKQLFSPMIKTNSIVKLTQLFLMFPKAEEKKTEHKLWSVRNSQKNTNKKIMFYVFLPN